jgi:hypothetical protein
MDHELMAQLASERQAKRRRDAAAERLVSGPRAAGAPVEQSGRVRSWRRAVDFRLVKLGLRTALGDERC